MSLLSAVLTWCLWFGGAAGIMLLDARVQRARALREQGADFVERSIWPYMALALLCGALPLIVYFGATRRGLKGWLIGLGACAAHLLVVAGAGAALTAAATAVSGSGEPEPPSVSSASAPAIAASSAPRGSTRFDETSAPHPWSASFNADSEALVAQWGPRLKSASDRLAELCAKTGQRLDGPLPADVAGDLASDTKVLELRAKCWNRVGDAGGFSGHAFEPLRGGFQEWRSQIWTMPTKAPGGLEVGVTCPSAWSDLANAADLKLEVEADAGKSEIVIAVLAPRPLASPERIAWDKANAEFIRTLVMKHAPVLEQIADKANCPASPSDFSPGRPSPALDTPAASNPEALYVDVSCRWSVGEAERFVSYDTFRRRPDEPMKGYVRNKTIRIGPTTTVAFYGMSGRFATAFDLTLRRGANPATVVESSFTYP